VITATFFALLYIKDKTRTAQIFIIREQSNLSSYSCSLAHPNMTTGKTTVLTTRTFVGKVMSLLSRLVMAYFPRSKRLLISWLQSLSAVILEPKKTKSVTVSIVSPSISH